MVIQAVEMVKMQLKKSSLTRITMLFARAMITLVKLMTIIDKIVTMLVSKLRKHNLYTMKNRVVVVHQLKVTSLIIIHSTISKQLSSFKRTRMINKLKKLKMRYLR